MRQKLQQLLIQYTNEDKYADRDFVAQVLSILIYQYGDNGLKSFSILTNEKKKGLSDFNNSLMGINLELIKNDLLSKFCYDDKKSNLYLVNIYVILVLMHEFNHFRQRKHFEAVVDSEEFLDKLFVKSFVFLIANDIDVINKANHTNYTDIYEIEKFYDLYHDCFAVERLAQIEAYKNLIDIISPISSVIGKPYYWLLNNYYAYKITGYCEYDDMILSPFDLLLTGMLNDNMEEELELDDDSSLDNIEDEESYDDFISSYSVYDRVCYGLTISEKEYFDTIDFMNVMYACAGNKGIMIEKTKNKIKKKDIK